MNNTAFYDETLQVNRRDWPELFRQPEMCAFELVMHDVKSSLAWQVIEGRRGDSKRSRDDEQQHLRRVFGIYYLYASHNKGEARSVILGTAATRLGMTAREVAETVRDAVLWGIPRLMNVSEHELRQVA